MSKEKNLTKLDSNGEVIVDPIMVVKDRVYYVRQNKYEVVAYGPAIDRLYEFEKLGLEPEEIIRVLEINTENIRFLKEENEDLRNSFEHVDAENRDLAEKKKELCAINYQKFLAINELQKANEELNRRLKNQEHAIRVCTRSLSDMRKECDNKDLYINNLEMDNERLKKDKLGLRERNEALVEENERLRMKNIGLKEENEALKQQLKLYESNPLYLSDVWTSLMDYSNAKREYSILEEKALRLQDKLDRIENIVEE